MREALRKRSKNIERSRRLPKPRDATNETDYAVQRACALPDIRIRPRQACWITAPELRPDTDRPYTRNMSKERFGLIAFTCLTAIACGKSEAPATPSVEKAPAKTAEPAPTPTAAANVDDPKE